MADIIISGKVDGDFDKVQHFDKFLQDGTLYDVYTIRKFLITKIIKNKSDKTLAIGDRMDVTEPSSVVDDKIRFVKVIFDDYQTLKNGSNYILFLIKNGVGGFTIVNMNSGRFNTDGTDPKDMIFSQDDKQMNTQSLQMKSVKESMKGYFCGNMIFLPMRINISRS